MFLAEYRNIVGQLFFPIQKRERERVCVCAVERIVVIQYRRSQVCSLQMMPWKQSREISVSDDRNAQKQTQLACSRKRERVVSVPWSASQECCNEKGKKHAEEKRKVSDIQIRQIRAWHYLTSGAGALVIL